VILLHLLYTRAARILRVSDNSVFNDKHGDLRSKTRNKILPSSPARELWAVAGGIRLQE
jgi:hypothetical protein